MAIEAEAGIDAPFEDVVENEIERRELRQIVAHDARRLARGESLSHPLGRHLRGHRRIMRRIPTDENEIEPVALVAGARAGNLLQTNNARHFDAPNRVTRGSAKRRSMRQEALASRGVMRLRTPAPPAGPAQ